MFGSVLKLLRQWIWKKKMICGVRVVEEEDGILP